MFLRPCLLTTNLVPFSYSWYTILISVVISHQLLASNLAWVNDWLLAERRSLFTCVPWWSGILSHSQWTTVDWVRGSLCVMTLQCLSPFPSLSLSLSLSACLPLLTHWCEDNWNCLRDRWHIIKDKMRKRCTEGDDRWALYRNMEL